MGNCHGDGYALFHASAEFMRVEIEDIDVESDLRHEGGQAILHPLAGLVNAVVADAVEYLVADSADRVQRVHCGLRDHCDVVAAHCAHLGFGKFDEDRDRQVRWCRRRSRRAV